jgi:phage terminase large subunit
VGQITGKTYGILPILINEAITSDSPIDITVVAPTVPHLKAGCMKDFVKIMKQTHRWIENNWNISDRKYTFTNGSTIDFQNADGDKAIGPRRNILYVNEANLIDFGTYDAMAIRTSGDIYIDFNPTAKFWAHTEVLTEDDAELLIINYLDNEGLPDVIKQDLEAKRKKAEISDYWANWWQVYGLGQIGRLQGLIFQNWTEIDTIPENAEFLGIGLDWGYTNDPTAAIAVYKHDGKLILDELFYQKGLSNKDIAISLLTHIKPHDDVYADSAEPKSIDEVFSYGVNIKPTKKGPDSILFGIGLLQEYEMLVTSRSHNLKYELDRYSWKVDKNNQPLNVPIDTHNHAIDAIRYLALMKLNNISSEPLISF